MARQGQFGRAATGASNLSDAIRSLVQQQKAQEESVLLNAFYAGTEYNGAVPTMQDIITFYENAASLSGIEKNTVEWTGLQQKIDSANNYDVKRQYNAIISAFNEGNGANYKDVIDFLANKATTSTDQGDLQDYAAAIESTTSAYLKYQGQALNRGELSAQQYQRIVMESLQVLDPGSTAYKTAVYDAMTYEWNAESTKWRNRIAAGTATPGQFTSWSNGFTKRVLSSGISKDSELFTSIGATVSNVNGAGGSSVASNRMDKIVSNLSDIWTIIKNQVGGGGGELLGTQSALTENSLLTEIQKNPDFALQYGDWIDNHPGMIVPSLSDKGIVTGDDFIQYWNDRLQNGLNVSNTARASGVKTDTQAWVNTAVYAGGLGVMAQTKFADTQWQSDRANANGSDVLLQNYDAEYAKYLVGLDSIYGRLAYQPNESEQGLINNQLAAMGYTYNPNTRSVAYIGANYDSNTVTVSTYQEGGSTLTIAQNNLTTIDETIKNAAGIASGTLIDEWQPNENLPNGGLFVAKSPMQGGFGDGVYQYVSIEKLPSGGTYAHAVYIKGTQIYDENGGLTDRFLYNLPTGSVSIIGSDGKLYKTPSVKKDLNGNYVVTSTDLVNDGSAPRAVFSGLVKDRTPSDLQGAVGDSFLERSAMLDRGVASDLRGSEAQAAAVLNAIDVRERDAVSSEVSTLGSQANGLEANAIATISASTANGGMSTADRAKIAELTGTQAEQQFWQSGEQYKYKETSPGSNIWVMKPEYVNTPNLGNVAAGAAIGAVSAAPIGLPLGPGGVAIASGVGGFIGGIATGVADFFGSATPIEQRSLDFRSAEQKANDLAAGSRFSAPQISAYQRTGYNTAGVPGSEFFRNLMTTPKVTPLTGPAANPYMQTQATVTTPGTIPLVKIPTVTAIQIQGVAGDSFLERRARIIANPALGVQPLATPQPLPKPIRGGV